MESNGERRTQLRSFLTYLRSRVSPADAGIPAAGRRRVPGLRREEVAELIGVSADWYRWFESGRPVSVSPRLIGRLCCALDINAYDQVTLYRLALPELDRAEGTAGHELPPPLRSNLTTIEFPSDIDDAQRAFEGAREAFLRGSEQQLSALRPRILGSWKRSQSLRVDANIVEAPLVFASDSRVREACEENHAMLGAAAPIVGSLTTMLSGMGYAISVTDARGHILQLEGTRAARDTVARAGIVPGGDLSEDAVGTNGIGTVIADRRPLQLMASEHFAQAGKPLTCTGAPIRDPRTGDVRGILVVMSDYRLIRPNLLPSVIRSALEIEEELAKREPAFETVEV